MPQVVISASRRTDIPAFYMPWFMASIGKGRFKVVNPYNRQTYRVPAAPEQVHSIVFWSKNFGAFLHHRHGETLIQRGYNLFFNFTVNSPHAVLEPAIPPVEERLDQLAALVQNFGPQCIQWRFDPICFFKDATGRAQSNLDGFETIAGRSAELGIKRCITSFADLYRKVVRRAHGHSNLILVDPPLERKVETIAHLFQLTDTLGLNLQLCCEKEVLAALPKEISVAASACIPGDRLIRLYGRGVSVAKDRGQRHAAGCACSVSKDIGSYDLHPCSHNCLFCYANPAMDGRP